MKRTTSYIKKSKSCVSCGLLPKGETGFNHLFCDYVYNAKQRGFSFELSKDQFRQLTSAPCHYCGCLPRVERVARYKNNRSSWGNYVYNGVDRIDNAKGYIFDNCVSCCRICNRGKGAWPYVFWVSHLKQLAENVLNDKISCLNLNLIKQFDVKENHQKIW